MKRVREEPIRRMMHAANTAMLMVAAETEATPDEVFSAYFTLTKAAIQTALEGGVPPTVLQAAVGQLLMECTGEEEILH